MGRWWANRRWIALGGGALAAVAAVVVLVWFQPQKLFIDVRVDEDLPGTAASPQPDVAVEPAEEMTTAAVRPSPDEGTAAPVEGSTPTPTGPQVVSREELRLISHHASGVASLVRLPDGSSVIRFEDLDVENGPDLRIYLSTAPADGPPDALDDDFVDLGALKGNQGNQNYPVPADVDLSRYRSVTIWCRRFSVGFAVAPIG